MSSRRDVARRDTRPASGGRVFAALMALGVLDLVLLACDERALDDRRGLNAPTGALVHGHALAPAWTFHAVDRRGNAACEAELSPLVGAPCCDPGHRHEPVHEVARTR